MYVTDELYSFMFYGTLYTCYVLRVVCSFKSNLYHRIFYRGFPGSATDCPRGAWCSGLSTCLLGPVSILRPSYLRMAISMLKIRRPLGRLIFNMGIAIPGKTVFLIETAPSMLVQVLEISVIWQLVCKFDIMKNTISRFNYVYAYVIAYIS